MERIKYENNPTELKIIKNYFTKENEDSELMNKLTQTGEISSLDKILLLYWMETPNECRRNGYATKALENLIKDNKEQYELIVAHALTEEGRQFNIKNNFKQLDKQTWVRVI